MSKWSIKLLALIGNILFWGALILFLIGTLVNLSSVCTAQKLAESGSINCFDFWLNRYQTLITGVVAVLVAWLTINAMSTQMRHAEKLATRIEDQSERTLREIIIKRAAILNEVWKGVDWALAQDDPIKRNKRAEIVNANCWYTGEERIEFETMKVLEKTIAQRQQPKIKMLLLSWVEMLDFLDKAREDELRVGNSKYDYAEKISFLRIKLSFIALALDRYDAGIANVFAGRLADRVNPGNTADRTRAVLESMMAEQEKKEAVGS